MGNCFGGNLTAEEKAALVRDRELARIMQKEKQKESRKVKLLLLGAGESGKSTFFKQMKINYGKPIENDELKNVIPHIIKNIFEEFGNVLTYAQEQGNLDLGSILGEDQVEPFLAALKMPEGSREVNPELTPELAKDISTLWASPEIKDIWRLRGTEYQALDSLEYYLGEINRIADPDFFPNTKDYLLNRVRSTGMTNVKLIIDKVEFDIMDVGGQRSERRKWIQCFDNVTAIIFVAAISEYGQTLFEDSDTDRISEAVTLFKRVLDYKIFKNHPIILFLNKDDIFRKRLFEMPLRIEGKRYDDFKGPYAEDAQTPQEKEEAYVAARDYMANKFLAQCEDPNRSIYHYTTTATDSQNVKKIFDTCVDIVLTRAIKDHFMT